MPRKPPPGAAWAPAPYEDADVQAVKALARDQSHKRALDWIIHAAAGTYDQSFRPGPDGERETAFAEGKRSVGLALIKLINTPAQQLLRNKSDAGTGSRDPERRDPTSSQPVAKPDAG